MFLRYLLADEQILGFCEWHYVSAISQIGLFLIWLIEKISTL